MKQIASQFALLLVSVLQFIGCSATQIVQPIESVTVDVESEVCEIVDWYEVNSDYGYVVVTNSKAQTIDGYKLTYDELGQLRFPSKAEFRIKVNGEPTSVAIHPSGIWIAAVASEQHGHTIESGLLPIPAEDRKLGAAQPFQAMPGFDAKAYRERAFNMEKPVLPGQPDSVAVSPDKRWLIVAIEAEEDSTTPGGIWAKSMAFTRGDAKPASSMKGDVLPGLEELVGEPIGDIEPEFVAFDPQSRFAAVTLQENDAVVLVDTRGDKPKLSGILRLDEGDEPDGVAVMDGIKRQRVFKDRTGCLIAVACEGRQARGGKWLGNRLVLAWVNPEKPNQYKVMARVTLPPLLDPAQPDKRCDPEGVALSRFGNRVLCFVGIERTNQLMVFDVTDPADPEY